jgi:predicted metalloendopeptidase
MDSTIRDAFDAAGNLKDWWSSADTKQFNDRTQCLVDQYAKYVVVGDITSAVSRWARTSRTSAA